MRLAILVLLLPAALSAQPASVDGLVLNRTTGQPIGGVHVRLITGDIFGIGGVDRAYGAITDKAGHFSITGMQLGLYEIVLERAGFVQAQTAGSTQFATVALKAGQNLTGRKFEMNPRAAILGRVVDEYGDPVQRVDVEVRRVPPDRESGPPFSGASRGSTDERGEFRILTSPGRYYVQAFPRTSDSDDPPEIRSDGSVPATYNPTYYPSAAEVGSAAVVQANPGEDVPGIEIHLRRTAPAGPVFTVSGLVTGVPEGARANVTLRFGDTSGWIYDSRGKVTEPGGKFSFTGLQPAFYSVIAQYSSGQTRLQSQSVDFNLDNTDRTDVQLNLRAGEELTGTLEMAGASPSVASLEKRWVYLRPEVSGYSPGAEIPSAETGKSGAFRFTDIHFGRFRVEVDPLPENAFIQSVTLDGKPAPDSILDFSRGVSGSRLRVTLSLGAQISGKVLGRDGEPSVSPVAQVLLWKDEKQLAGADRVVDSAYRIQALRPGKYRLAAFDPLETGAPDNWEEAMKAFKAVAQEIEVKEGDRLVKDLKVLSNEDLHAK